MLGCSDTEAGQLAPALVELATPCLFDDKSLLVRVFRSTGLLWPLWNRRHRHADLALEHVARSYGRFPADVRGVARAIGAGRWGRVTGPVLTDPSRRARRSLGLLAEETCDAALASTLPALLSDADRSVSRQAERALVVQALAAAGLSGAELTGDVGLVREAVLAGVASFPHHRARGVLVALLALANEPGSERPSGARTGKRGRDEAPAFLRGLAAETASSLRTVLGATRLPLARLRAMQWLRYSEYESACVRRLLSQGTRDEHEAAWCGAHLMAHPARSRAWVAASGRTSSGLWPTVGTYASLSAGARAGVARVAAAIGGATPPGELVAAMTVDQQPLVRMLAAKGLGADAARDLVFDEDARVAGVAVTRLVLGEVPDGARARLARLLVRSPHASVRSAAAMLATDRYGAARLLRDPGSLTRVLHEALELGPEEQWSAVQAVRRLRLGRELVPSLIRLVRQPVDSAIGSRVQVSAATALCEAGTPAAMQEAAALISHPEPRVRANCIDALGGWGRGPVAPVLRDRLVELKRDPHHRVQANSLRVILGARTGAAQDAAEQLRGMLDSPSALHRLAGVWALSRVRQESSRSDGLSERLIELAERDGDPRVRARASLVRSRGEATTRQRWERATPREVAV